MSKDWPIEHLFGNRPGLMQVAMALQSSAAAAASLARMYLDHPGGATKASQWQELSADCARQARTILGVLTEGQRGA